MSKSSAALPENVDSALGECMQAVVEPALWTDAMDGMAEALGLVGCCFNPKGARSRLTLPVSTRYRAMLEDFLAEGWWQHDLRAQRGWRLVEAGQTLVTEDDISSAEERAKLPLYHDFLGPRDMSDFVAVGFMVGDQAWSFSGARARARGPLDADQALVMKRLAPYLSRMVRLSAAARRRSEAGALQAFDTAGQPAILLDWLGRVIEVTDLARNLLGARLDIRKGRVVASDTVSNAALQAMIHAATAPNASISDEAFDAVVIRGGDDLPLIIEAVPANGALADGFGFSGALLMVTPLAQSQGRNEKLIRAAWGLTQREAQVASLLVAGQGADEIAAGLGLRASSVRQMIKHILAKTGAPGKAELVALLSRLPKRHP